MTNKRAKELSLLISNQDLNDMLVNAANSNIDWTKPSKANKGISRGSNWNMFCKDFDINIIYDNIVKYRMIQEFGDFLPLKYKTEKKVKRVVSTTHFEPDLSKFKK